MGSSSSAITLPNGVQTNVVFKGRKKVLDSTLSPELEIVPTEIEDVQVYYMKKFFLLQEAQIQAEKTIKKFTSLLSQHVSQMFGAHLETNSMTCSEHPYSLVLFGEYFPCTLEKEIEQRQLLPELSEYKYLNEGEGLYILEVITATFILFKAQDINSLYYQTKHIMIEPSGTLKVLNPIFMRNGILADPLTSSFKMPSIYPINHKDRAKMPPKSDSSVVWLIGVLVLCAMSNTLEEEIYLENFEISQEKMGESIQLIQNKISETLAEILIQCLVEDPGERPTLPALYSIIKHAMETQNPDDSID